MVTFPSALDLGRCDVSRNPYPATQRCHTLLGWSGYRHVIFDELNDLDPENELEFPLETVPFIRSTASCQQDRYNW